MVGNDGSRHLTTRACHTLKHPYQGPLCFVYSPDSQLEYCAQVCRTE